MIDVIQFPLSWNAKSATNQPKTLAARRVSMVTVASSSSLSSSSYGDNRMTMKMIEQKRKRTRGKLSSGPGTAVLSSALLLSLILLTTISQGSLAFSTASTTKNKRTRNGPVFLSPYQTLRSSSTAARPSDCSCRRSTSSSGHLPLGATTSFLSDMDEDLLRIPRRNHQPTSSSSSSKLQPPEPSSWQSEPAPDLAPAFAQQQWLMPSIVERALGISPRDHENSLNKDDKNADGDAQRVNAHDLLRHLDMSDQDRQRALEALEHHHDDDNKSSSSSSSSSSLVQTVPGLLTQKECATLRRVLHERLQDELGVDNVDGCPDWQINLSFDELTALLGRDAVERLCRVPQELFGARCNPSGIEPNQLQQTHNYSSSTSSSRSNNDRSSSGSGSLSSSAFTYKRIGVFVRLYQRDKRPWMPFHRDGSRWTLNVALNDSADYAGGGQLLCLTDGALHVLPSRETGDATCHAGSVQHAVSAMAEGGHRYTMIVFFHTHDDEGDV